MRRFLYVLLTAMLCTATMANHRHTQTLKKGWKFTRTDDAAASAVSYDDSQWQSVTVPHDWAIYGPFDANNDRQQVAIEQDGQKEAMKNKLEAITGKTVVLVNRLDPSILGGVVLRYSGVQLDGSIRSRLDEFKKNLSNIVM